MTGNRVAQRVALALSLCLTATSCTGDSTPSLATSRASLSLERSYLVLYRAELVPADARSQIAQAGGELVASYSKLGVALARSSRSDFADLLALDPLVDSVAATSAGVAVGSLARETAPKSLGPQKRTMAAPNLTVGAGDPLTAMQWNMSQIHAAEARAITPGVKSVLIGVLDSGIDDNHPDLQGQVDATRSVTCIGGVTDGNPARWRFDSIGHGSHVAGIIAAKENGRGTVGVAPGITLAAVKLSDDGFIYPEAFICGLYWAATHDFDLVNASLFTDPWYYHCGNDPVQRTLTVAQQRAVSYAARRGVTIIAAASNENQDLVNPKLDPCKLLPVQLDNVIGVSALAANKALTYYSNYGLGAIDLAAPGGDMHVAALGNPSGQIIGPVPSYSYYYQTAWQWGGRVGIGCSDGLDPNDAKSNPKTCAETYALLQGTSQAAPHVTGVAALALSRYGKLSTVQLLATLTRGAQATACPSGAFQPYADEMPAERCEGTREYNGFYGGGQLDALGALSGHHAAGSEGSLVFSEDPDSVRFDSSSISSRGGFEEGSPGKSKRENRSAR
jgi:subtilisin family serine protease